MMSDKQLAAEFGGQLATTTHSWLEEDLTTHDEQDENGMADSQQPPRLELSHDGITQNKKNLTRSQSEFVGDWSNQQNGAIDTEQLRNKFDSFKNWTLNTYKCSKQAVLESLNKCDRTTDPELDGKINTLREQQRDYYKLLTTSRGYTCYIRQAAKMQAEMVKAMQSLAPTEPHTTELFRKNAHSNKCVIDSTEVLLAALDTFNGGLTTMVEKTIEDTIKTIKDLDYARLEYDAHRNELARIQQRASASGINLAAEVHEAEQKANEKKLRYDQLKKDVEIKMRLLEDNRTKVMQKHLALLHSVTCAFYHGNVTSMQAAIANYSVKLSTNPNQPNGYTGDAFRPFQSFLEKSKPKF